VADSRQSGVEREAVARTLAAVGGNRKKAADLRTRVLS
jgi:hypothetical protein